MTIILTLNQVQSNKKQKINNEVVQKLNAQKTSSLVDHLQLLMQRTLQRIKKQRINPQ